MYCWVEIMKWLPHFEHVHNRFSSSLTYRISPHRSHFFHRPSGIGFF
jgi:hypothetical protein